ncbi:UNVERIFIED_CONTAM: hypothetical protein PYX00_006056 [Menopon gallinae]|uniref:Uncharacterized protein n=1 Tax=Menopon gallinae TaxID=328185 RepID=A0AAW2HU10_9NEOP
MARKYTGNPQSNTSNRALYGLRREQFSVGVPRPVLSSEISLCFKECALPRSPTRSSRREAQEAALRRMELTSTKEIKSGFHPPS